MGRGTGRGEEELKNPPKKPKNPKPTFRIQPRGRVKLRGSYQDVMSTSYLSKGPEFHAAKLLQHRTDIANSLFPKTKACVKNSFKGR